VTPRLTVDPLQSLVDEPVSIRANGCPPGGQVTVRARLTDDAGRVWESWAAFEADAAGSVDVASQRPLDGTYHDPDPIGLLWSLTLAPGEEQRWSVGRTAAPMQITLTAEAAGAVSEAVQVERRVAAPAVTQVRVRDDGLVATFFQPGGAGPFPAVLVLGGSGGGLPERNAALLASRGIAALALAYFRAEHLPADLVEIPLEYFETAIRWLRRHPSVDASCLGVMGSSRGGELALLLGATFQEIRAVVGYVPSGVGHAGIASAGAETTAPRAAWTYRGAPIPFLSRPGGRLQVPASPAGEPFALTPLFLQLLEDERAVAAALIPVERINGPVLLISGQDDAMWPSPVLAEYAMTRLAQHRHPHAYTHLSYPGAGHMIGAPGLPATFTASVHPLRRSLMAYGGRPKDNAAACWDSWRRILTFFRENLAKEAPAAKR
jgi:dienelactone hydrolase